MGAIIDNKELEKRLKKFLLWFKEVFPYYRSTCLHCANAIDNTFIGLCPPSPIDKLHNASVTETYVCRNESCGRVYRFPRAVLTKKLLQTKRGRCGEYSNLMFKSMEALNFTTRWIVDWEDHVWVEIWQDWCPPGEQKWLHVDPCEAAIDEPLLYQGWGKSQSCILAFTRTSIDDVTHVYTTKLDEAKARRGMEQSKFDKILRETEEFLVK